MATRKLRFALFGNVYQASKSVAVRQMLAVLAQHGAEVCIDEEYFCFLKEQRLLDMTNAETFSGNQFTAHFVISMGGDGTFLKAASRVGAKSIPILGVNMGRLGFLADISPKEIPACIDALYQGDYAVENRTVICVETTDGQQQTRDYALNDVAILKRDSASMISIHTHINGEYLNTYQADGLIVSTPTGSTAYSLSVGGPIIVPGTHVLSLTAVAPHSLNIRPIVVPDNSEVTLSVESRSHSFLVAVDGRSEKCREGTDIRLYCAPYDVKVIKRAGTHFFSTLREKLMWGADTRQ